jgi:cyclophilin family peptidyl-prolyl cis-trans isomerase
MNLATALFLLAQAAQAPVPAPAATPSPEPTPFAGPIVVLETSLGKVKLGLRPEKAPLSVKNFLTYVKAGHYDGTIFHRVMPGFMAQGGGFEEDMTERPTRPPILNEAKNGLSNRRGTLAMARTNDPNSATAQFFINVNDNHGLDFGVRGAGYAVFGEVLEGMDVVDKIVAVPTTRKGQFSDVPRTPVFLTKARLVSAGTVAPKPTATAAPAAPGAAAKPKPKPKPPAPAPTPKP